MLKVAMIKLLIHFGETQTRGPFPRVYPDFGKHCAFFNKCIGKLKTDLLFLAGSILFWSWG